MIMTCCVAFDSIDDPRCDGGNAAHPPMVVSHRFDPMRKITTPDERTV